MSQDNPFDILGISLNAEAEVISAAYRALARKYHPDLNPGVPAEELNARMVKLNWAKAELESNLTYWLNLSTIPPRRPRSDRGATNASRNSTNRSTSKDDAPNGAIAIEPQVLHLSGSVGTSGTIHAWSDGLASLEIRARFKAGLIEVERLPPVGTRAAFFVKIAQDFTSDLSGNFIQELEFVAAGFISKKAFVSVAPLTERVISQRYGGRVAPPRHASPDAMISFGKHRGRRFSEIALEEPGYLHWMLEEGAGSQIERECARMALQLQGGTWLPPARQTPRQTALPRSRRSRTSPVAVRPPPLARSLPDPNRSGSLLRLLKGIFGQRT